MEVSSSLTIPIIASLHTIYNRFAYNVVAEDSSLLPLRYLPPSTPSSPILTQSPSSRPQKHHRRRPPQLPHLPQIRPIPPLHRHPPRSRLHRRNNSRRRLLRRLEIRLGCDQILDVLGGAGVFRAEWCPDGVDMGGREGYGF